MYISVVMIYPDSAGAQMMLYLERSKRLWRSSRLRVMIVFSIFICVGQPKQSHPLLLLIIHNVFSDLVTIEQCSVGLRLQSIVLRPC